MPPAHRSRRPRGSRPGLGRPRTGLASPLLAALPLALLVACGPGDDPDAGAEQLSVLASFYPLEYLTERVAGDRAEVSTLTSPGVDPHDVELTPRLVGSLGSADLVVYAEGMQPAVDRAVDTQAADHALDVTPAADLMALGETQDDAHGTADPHFWLDPERYGHVAEAIAEQLSTVDPDHAEDYQANAAQVVGDLETLDEEFTHALASCESRDLVTTHEAFGYLAQRYDLHQIAITGISPESEPSPARLAEVSAQVHDLGVSTIYTEPFLSDAIARTVAQETGTEVRTLDPVEGITEASPGADYLEVMRANLVQLSAGLGCS